MKTKKKMSMYKKGGFNPRPDTSYQSPASKAARKKVAKDQKEKDMADIEFIRSLLRQSRQATVDGSKGEKFNVPKSSKKMQDTLKKSFKGGGKMMKGMMNYAMGGKMDKDMMKMYATGGMLKALLKDPKQREMAKKMLGSMEKGGMMKYQEGGMTPDSKKKSIGLRPKNPLSQEEIAEMSRRKREKAARARQNMMTYSSAGKMVIDSPFESASQSQAKINFRQKKELAKMGVEDLTKFFESEMYKGKGPKPSKEQIEKFVAKYSK